MQEFYDFLKDGFKDYDAPYVKDQQFVMLVKKEDHIIYSFANVVYNYLAGYPNILKEYNDPNKLLKDELKYFNATKGVIFENTNSNNKFKKIAFIDLNENL